ncbi:MAG: putative 2-dehydropantoate 2-reductase [Oscillatoria sp. PMC 1051.18]|nr:putative 2-dehydropantoate 2-reductase [Oscillatoria sp. PMC 1050.18]MEC5029822.1 putative 2-dehydropantoate 2-reductase [Oscillatoria sp. PMC 1051.18]
MSSRSYAIIGTGAIGGFYGACLQRDRHDVHFLLRSDYDRVQEHGLIIESVQGDFTLPHVQAYNDAAKMPACDVAVVALKATQNHILRQILPHVLKDDGVVLLLQNGLGCEPEIAEIVGSRRVIGGLCFICANKVGAGHIRHLDYGAVKLAEYADDYQACGITGKMREIAGDFEAAGIPVELGEDLARSRWEKLIWNIPYNGLSVVLDATTEEMMADKEMRLLITNLMQEVLLGAKSNGREIPDSFVQKNLDHTDKMEPYLTSMKLDYDRQQPLEIEAIFGNPLRSAAAAGVSLPRIEMLYQQLKFLDRKNRS